ncbi:hypothetical protein ANCDUO_27320, partial [Ancylostoma duodenale]
NGQAERFVDTFKRAFEKLRGEGTTQEALQRFLLNYRRTPCPTLPGKQSPAEAFLGRRLRSTLILLKPSEPTTEDRRDHKMENQFNHHHGARPRLFEPDALVWTRDYRKGYPRWSPGRVLLRHGQCLYDVQVDGQLRRRQANQLRPRTCHTAAIGLTDEFDFPLLPCTNGDPSTQDRSSALHEDRSQPTMLPAPALIHRPTRTRRQPARLQVDPRLKTYAADDSLRREVLEPEAL